MAGTRFNAQQSTQALMACCGGFCTLTALLISNLFLSLSGFHGRLFCEVISAYRRPRTRFLTTRGLYLDKVQCG